MKSFASDNTAGVHPRIMDALCKASAGHAAPYGDDEYTAEVRRQFMAHLGEDIAVFPVFAGTAANVLALRGMLKPWQAVICSDVAHINVDETGAPESMAGLKLLAMPSCDGKLTPEAIEPALANIGVVHHAQPGVLSITQATEYGTVYTVDEVKALADVAHSNGLLLHMDGARIANAAASLGVSLRQVTRDAGVDVLSFGGTKNGLMFGEVVVVFKPELAEGYNYLRKQYGQLSSKMRFISAQFIELLKDGLWLESATHANAMTAKLATGLKSLSKAKITRPVQGNAVFACLPADAIAALREEYLFNVWDAATNEVRLMTSFATSSEDVEEFIEAIRAACS
ncbi:threonine aldolase family protein [Oleidesulfovibrio sp.]|uniref:threonine aldolase family protein n=1 Tax=Oleidesulfovibrio sp. TaxID=2909707 RepID=UPI003A89B2E5